MFIHGITHKDLLIRIFTTMSPFRSKVIDSLESVRHVLLVNAICRRTKQVNDDFLTRAIKWAKHLLNFLCIYYVKYKLQAHKNIKRKHHETGLAGSNLKTKHISLVDQYIKDI